MPISPTGLQKNSKTGAYYLRRRIPADLLSSYPGKKEIVFSLRTKEYRTAVERLRLEDAKLTTEWIQRRQRLANIQARNQVQACIHIDALTPDVIDAICKHVEAASLAGDEARRENNPYCIEEVEEYREAYQAANRILKSAVACGEVDLLRHPLEQFLQLYRYDVSNASDADIRRLALAYGRAAIRQ